MASYSVIIISSEIKKENVFPVFTVSKEPTTIFLTCKTSITHWGILVLNQSFDGEKRKGKREREREQEKDEEKKKKKEREKS